MTDSKSTQHTPSKLSNEATRHPPFMFRLVNSTASFGSLKFSLESQNAQFDGNMNKDQPTGTRTTGRPRCALIESSTVILTHIEFQLEAIISPLLITSTDSSPDASSFVTLVSCVIQTGTPLIPSFTEIMSEQPSSTAAVVTVASASISSLSLLGESGIASTVNSKSSSPRLSTIVTTSHFHNLTATPLPHSQPRHRPTQVLAGNEMVRVDDALYGTVASILGHSQSFDLINSTLLECENPRTTRNEDDATIKNITGTHTFTSWTGSFRNETGFTHYHFTSCIITSTEQTQAFNIILIAGLSGAVKLTNCSFTIDCKSYDVTLMNLRGVTEGKQSLSIDSCSVKFDKNETLPQTSTQIQTYYSIMTDITHSTFESPKGDSRTRTFVAFDSVAFIQTNNCLFKGQTTSSSGSVFLHSNAYQILLLSDSLFEGNKAGGHGGSLATNYAHQSFSRCVFRKNEADMRGGALYMHYPQHLFLEDTHFDNNKAKEKLTTTNDYAHYRGNDIHLTTHNISFFSTVNVIGCTSSTPSNKIGFYHTAVNNADFADQKKFFPAPIETKAKQLFVETGRTGEDCDESNPCSFVSAAISKAESIFTQIHVAVGDYSLSDETITKSIQIVGQGWMVNSTKSTILKMGEVCVGSNGNLTLTSLSLKPLNTSSVILSHSAATATSLVKDVRIENVAQHTVPLFSFSQGKATLRVCTFNTIALTTSAAVSVSGSASLTLYQVWFMHISSLSTTGGSCLDVNTSASVSIEMSDASRCSSNGPAGAFFITKVGSSTLTLKSLIFTENKASLSLSQIGNDIVLSGFLPSFVSISSPISSVSNKPHCLVRDNLLDCQIQNFQIPNFGYHEYGIHHPINTRFYFGLPMSQFKGVSQTVNNLVSPGTQVDIRIKNTDTIIMEDTTFTNRKADLRLLVIQHNSTSPTSRYLLREDVTLRLISGQIQLPADPLTTPFIVDGSNSLLLLGSTTITLPPILSRPFIINKAGTTHMNGAGFNSHLSLQGCSFIESLSGTVNVDYRTISNVHSDVDGSYLNAKNTSLQFQRFEFVNCSAKNGGALFAVLDGSNFIQFQFYAPYTTSFRDCRATALDENGVLVGKGGAIYVKGTSTDARPIRFNTTALNHARFENNTAGRGNDIFIESSLFAGKTVDQIPVFGGGSLSSMYRVAIEGRDSEEDKETIHYFLPSPSISVNGSVIEPISGVSGKDDDNCKWVDTPCATLEFGVKHLKQKYEDGRHFPQQIRFVWNMTYTEKAIVITEQDITVSGTTTTNAKTAKVLRSILEVDKDAVEGSFIFTINNTAQLAVTNLDIHPIAKCGLFDLKDDAHSLKLDGVGVICSDSESYRHPFIKSTKHPVTLQNCHFNTTDESRGPAICAVPLVSFSSTEHSFSIKSSSFKSFSVSGHALLAITTEQPISFVSVKFDDITQTVSGKARCIHVTSSSLGTVVTASLWTGSFSPTQHLLDFVGCDSSLTSDHPFFESSLLFHLLPPTGTVVAGQTPDNEESEHPECGTDRLRCSTLNSALSSALSHSLSTHIDVAGQVNLSSPLEVTTTATFSSSSGKQTVAQSSAGTVTMNKIGDTLSFVSLMFSLDHSSLISSLFHVSTGTLSLTACDIGTPTMTTLNEICLSLADVADGASLSLTGSVFQNVKFSHPSLGTAIVLRLGSSFSSDTASLFSSVSSNAAGSLVFVESADISSTAQLPSFILLKTTMEPLPSRLFTDEEKKRFVGKVDGKDAESLLFFWFPHSANDATLDVDGNGEDHPNCGLPQLPCRTLETGFTSLKATKSALFLNSPDRIKTVLATAFAEQTIKSKNEKHEVTIECMGGLTVSTNQQLILYTIAFVFEAGKRTSPFASVSAGSLQLMSCSFGTDTPTALGSSLLHVKGSVEVESSSFSKLSTTDEKGLIWMEQANQNIVSFVSTTIACCTSSSAPLISLTLSSTSRQDSWDFDFSGISFTEPSSNDAPTGTLVFISGSSFATQIVPSRFPLINSETDENKFWGFDSLTSVDSSLLVYLVEIGSEVDVDGKKGKDIAYCGHFGVACQTIGKGIGRGTAEHASKQINIQDATKMDERITPNSITLSIVGETGQQPISVLEEGQFEIKNGKLVLSSLSFETDVASFARSLIALHTAGSLTITSCSFTSFSSSTSPSVLSATIQPTQSVTLSNTSFISCNSTASTRSGVLDVTLSEGSTFTLTHSTKPFASCSSPKATANQIFISSPSFGQRHQLRWQTLLGKEGDHPVPVPLFLYFSSLGEEVFISNDSCDVSVCGFSEYPCASLAALHSRIEDTPDTTVTFRTSIDHSAELTFTEDTTLAGNEQHLVIKETSTSETPNSLFTIRANMSIEQLFVEIPSTFQHSSLLQCQSGSLEMSNCSLTQKGSTPIPSTLIQILAGSSLSVSKTFFTRVISSNEKAGVISAIITESTYFLLNNNTFASCSCSGQANAIFLELENTTTVHADSFDYLMTDLVLDSSSSNSDTEIEIDVFVVGNNLDKTMTSTKWENSFSREKGSSLWGEDTATGLNISLLPYLVALEGPVEIDDDGKGFEKCGHFFLFCNSLELGLRRMKEASVATMKVMEKITTTTLLEPKCDLCIYGNEESSTLSFSLDGCFVNSPKDATPSSLSFSSLAIIVPSESNHQSLFSSLSGTLSFTSCTVTGSFSNPIIFSLITLTTGDLLFSFTHSKSIALQSTPLIASSGSITMTNCNFTSISRVDGLGCVLEADSSGSILVQHCLFVSCISNSTTNWIHLLGADTHTLNKENWEGTLNTSSLRSSVLLSTSLLSASSISGADPFDPHSLLYEFYPRTTPRIVVQKDEKNEDHPLCGSGELPCLSVDTSVDLTKVRTVEINGEGEVKTQMKMDGDFLTIEGHKKRGVVKIVGKGQIVNNVFDDPDTLLLSFVSLDLSQSTLEEGGIVVNENGEVKLDSNIVSSLSTIRSSLIQLTGGQAVVVNLTLTDLSFSPTVFDFSSFDSVSLSEISTTNCSIGKFVKASEGTRFSLKSSSFVGSTTTPSENEEQEEDLQENVCDWPDSFMSLINTTSTIEMSKFSHLQIGAVEMDGGSLTIDGSIFHDNAVDNSSFPSVRRNIHCLAGRLTMETLSGGDGQLAGSSAWIAVEEGCQFSSLIVDAHAPLFIPTLLPSLSKVETNKKTAQKTVKLAGKLLIPCGLSLEVFEWNEKSKTATDKSTEISLVTANIQNWNETSLELILNESSLSNTLNVEHEWRLRLVFGDGVAGVEWITLKQSRAAEKKAQTTQAMKVLLPIVISVIAALALFTIIVCVVCCRRKAKQSEEKQNLLNQQELDHVEVKVDVEESMNMMADRFSNNFPPKTLSESKLEGAGFTGNVELTKKEDEEGEEEPHTTAKFLCEAMRCDGSFEMCVVDTRHSLHTRIHKPAPNAPPLPRFQIAFEIIEGLKRMSKEDTLQRFLSKLNPHRILLGTEDQVFLKVEETAAVPPDKQQLHPPNANDPHPTPHPHHLDAISSYDNDNLQRWVAPELGETDKTRDTAEGRSKEDLVKASVFSLGLVLLEMETGIVPFGEIDGINAQRQLGTGTRPNMTDVGAEMKDLISECLDVDKTARPTLSTVEERLIEIGQKTEQLTSGEAESIQDQLKKRTAAAPI
ncbi:hypothetical protein BLNAU_7075 [Blattamonas nauphoetae]|uniref:Protein kinase domain-containing protein n=1 Tax=Blattamonas nauphoetae TaxID=2049346 RepID=A0ABQ9Y2C8_9EUKA|nr:hypothetical protein BLNAU_7075 [Blattamonas nauphoetae]